METVNSEQAQRVWNRVRGTAPEKSAADLEPLIAEEWEASAAYLALAKRTEGRHTALLQQLARQSRSRWACLQGISLLRTGRRPGHIHPKSPAGSSGEILRRCCSRAMGTVELYGQLCSQESSPVFPLLAQEQTRDCRILLELLGNWGD